MGTKDDCAGLIKAQEDIRRHGQALAALERGHDELAVDMADLALRQNDMGKQLEEAMERALERVADKFLDRLQQRAAEQTGRWVWGTVKAVLSRWIVIGFVVVMIGKWAGIQSAVAVFDMLTGKGK